MRDLDRRRLLRAGLALAGMSVAGACQIALPGAGAPARMRRVGFLTSDPGQGPPEAAFRQALGELGHIEGQNTAFESRVAADDASLRQAVDELIRLGVDVIVTGAGDASLAAKSATSTIPIVMAYTDNPVGSGLVASLSRPGGNVTGLSSFNGLLAPKRLELLREVLPGLSRMGILWDMAAPSHAASVNELEGAARSVGVESISLELTDGAGIEAAFDAATRVGTAALMTTPGPIFGRQRTRLAELALQHRLPLMGNSVLATAAGALMSYATDYTDLFRRAAIFVDKIFKGRSPAELPVEQPTKFEFVVNLKTARMLDLSIPPSLLAQATQVLD
jgi:putative tryptophan/tyrosine transport system substrate-binding protein